MLFIYIFTYFLETAYYRHSESSTPLVILRPWVVDWQRIESGPTVLKSGTQPTELDMNMDPWVDIFENSGWSFSFGRTKTKTRSFSNTMVSFIISVLMDKKTIWITYAWMRTVSKNAENIPAFNTKFMHFYF